MILIIDTSLGNKISIGLDSAFYIYDSEKQTTDLPRIINELDINWQKVHAIGVVVGPGSFTGIRLGIAYAKGAAMGRGVPLIGINAFELYMAKTPDAFVAIDTGRGDFYVGAHDLLPSVMDIDTLETAQMAYPKTVGHKPYDLSDAIPIVNKKLELPPEPVIPLYIKPSYVEQNCKSS